MATGDYVELPDPRLGPAGVEHRYVAVATVFQGTPDAAMHRVKAEWSDPPHLSRRASLPFDAWDSRTCSRPDLHYLAPTSVLCAKTETWSLTLLREVAER